MHYEETENVSQFMTMSSHIEPRINRTAEFTTLGMIILVLIFIAAASAMNGQYNHDEESYLSATSFARNLTLYRDFIYTQTPLYPLITRIGLQMSDGNVFLVGRLVTFAMTLIAFGAIMAAAWALTRSIVLASMAGLMLGMSTVIVPIMGFARNDMMAVAFSVLSCALFLVALSSHRAKRATLLFAGIFASASVATKISFAFVPIATLLYAVMLVRAKGVVFPAADALTLFLGMLVGATPIIAFGLLARDNFLYGVFIHGSYATEAWYQYLGASWELAPRPRVTRLVNYLLRDIGLGCVIVIAYWLVRLFLVSGKAWSASIQALVSNNTLLPLLLAVLALPFTFLPKAGNIQYFVLIIPFLILGAVGLANVAQRIGIAGGKQLLVVVALVGSLPGALEHFDIFRRGSEVARIEEQSAAIRVSLERLGVDGPIATLSPIRPAIAGYEVYPEFSGGPFFFRTGDELSPDQIHELVGVTPNTLTGVLAARPPAAIYVGIESLEDPRLDGALVGFAEAHGYVPVEGFSGRGRIYVPGEATVAP